MPSPLTPATEVAKISKAPSTPPSKGKMEGGQEVIKFGDIEGLQIIMDANEAQYEQQRKKQTRLVNALAVIMFVGLALMFSAVAAPTTPIFLAILIPGAITFASSLLPVIHTIFSEAKSHKTYTLQHNRLKDLQGHMYESEKFKAYAYEKNLKSMPVDGWLQALEAFKKKP